MPLDPTAYSSSLLPARFAKPGDILFRRVLAKGDTTEEVVLRPSADGFLAFDANGQPATLTAEEMIEAAGAIPGNRSSLGEVSVTDLGAVGDGVTDDTAVLQAALDAFPSLFFPEGTYLQSEELLIPSDRRLRFAAGAILKRADASLGAGECCNIRNSDYENGNENITIIGGIFDGNNANQTRVDLPGYVGGAGIRFKKVTNLSIDGWTIRNPVSFGAQLGDVHRWEIFNTRFDYTNMLANMDGIHVNGPSSGGFGAGSKGNTNDDCWALNADDGEVYQLTAGPITDIKIDGVYCSSGYRGVRILSGGNRIDDIEIRNVAGVYSRAPILFSEYSLGDADIGRVNIRGVTATQTSNVEAGIYINSNFENITISDVVREVSASTSAAIMFDQAVGGTCIVKGLTCVDLAGGIQSGIVLKGTTLDNLTVSDAVYDRTLATSATDGSFIQLSTTGTSTIKNLVGSNWTLKRCGKGIWIRTGSASVNRISVAGFVTEDVLNPVLVDSGCSYGQAEISGINATASGDCVFFQNTGATGDTVTLRGTQRCTGPSRLGAVFSASSASTVKSLRVDMRTFYLGNNLLNSSSTVSRINIAGSEFDDVGYCVRMSGTLTGACRIDTEGMGAYSAATAVIQAPASGDFRVTGLGLPVNQTLLTPATYDRIMHNGGSSIAAGPYWYNGSAWVAL